MGALMGAYLPEPNIEKTEDNYCSETLSYGVSAMQGWRIEMEDAQCCLPEYDKDSSLFGVFDGHGGSEIAIYCAQRIPKMLKSLKEYENGKYKAALEKVYLAMDEEIKSPEVVSELKKIVGVDNDNLDDTEENIENEIADLKAESEMPLDDLLKKYKNCPQPTQHYLSPMIRKSKRRSNGLSGLANGAAAAAKQGEGDEEVNSIGSYDCNGYDKTSTGWDPKPQTTKHSRAVQDFMFHPGFPYSTNDTDYQCRLKTDIVEEVATVEAEKVEVGKVKVEGKNTETESLKDVKDETKEADDKDNADIKDVDKDVSMDDDDESEEDMESDSDESSSVEVEQSSSEDEESSDDDVVDKSVLNEDPGIESGTTAVVALLRGERLYVANAGDSRAVLCRDGVAEDLSEDHKPEDEAEKNRIEKAGGKITKDGRVNGGLNLSRAIGDHFYKRNTKLSLKEQMISALPDVKEVTVDSKAEFLVIACDGIWNVMTSQDVVDFVKSSLWTKDSDGNTKSLSSICGEMFSKCLASNTHGDGTGCDNMTCQIILFRDYPTPKVAGENGSNKRPRSCSESVTISDVKKSRSVTDEATV